MPGKHNSGFILTLDAIISLTIVSLVVTTVGFVSHPIPDFEVMETYRIANNLIDLCGITLEDNLEETESCTFTLARSCQIEDWLTNLNPALEGRIYFETPTAMIYDHDIEELVDIYLKDTSNPLVQEQLFTLQKEKIRNVTTMANNSLILQFEQPIDVTEFMARMDNYNFTGNAFLDRILEEKIRKDETYRAYDGGTNNFWLFDVQSRISNKTRHLSNESHFRWLPDLDVFNQTTFLDLNSEKVNCDEDEACTGQNSPYRVCVRKIIPMCSINYPYVHTLNATNGNVDAADHMVKDDPYCTSIVCPYPMIVKLCLWRKMR